MRVFTILILSNKYRKVKPLILVINIVIIAKNW